MRTIFLSVSELLDEGEARLRPLYWIAVKITNVVIEYKGMYDASIGFMQWMVAKTLAADNNRLCKDTKESCSISKHLNTWRS